MAKDKIWLILILCVLASTILERTMYKPANKTVSHKVEVSGKTMAMNAKRSSDNSIHVQTKLDNETVTFNYKDGCVHNKEQWEQMQNNINVQKALITLSHIRRIKEGFRDFCKNYSNINIYENAVSQYYKEIESDATQTIVNNMGKDYYECYKNNMVPEFRKLDIKFAQHEFDSVKGIGIEDKATFCRILNDKMLYASTIESSKIMLDEMLKKAFLNNRPIKFNF